MMTSATSADHGVAVDYDPFADAPLARVVPATESQREIWLAASIEPAASLAYNEAITLELHGALDARALRRAAQAILDRHEALRGTLSPDGAQFCIAVAAELPFVEHDWSHLDEAARKTHIAEACERAVEREFDLGQCPLLRCELLRLSADEHLLILATHHIVCDGWSFGVIVRDLAALYAIECEGSGQALAAADSFADFAEGEARHPLSAEFHADETYWLSRFTQLPEPLELPLDRPRPRQRGFASKREDLVLDGELVAAVKRLGASKGASLYATLLASFGVLLQRLCGQDDLVVGIPSAGQSGIDQAGLVGHAVNVLPLRMTLDPANSFADTLIGVRGNLLDAFEHQRYTFGTLLKRLAMARDPGRLPLVSVLFNLDPGLDDDSLGFKGLKAKFAGVPRSYENFELFINAVQAGASVRLECQYNSGLFDAQTIRRWLDLYATLLADIAADGSRPLSALKLLSAQAMDELHALQPAPKPFVPSRIESLVFAQAASTPDQIALHAGEQSWTYAELAARARSIAAALRKRGIGADALVGVMLDRNPDMIAAILGVLASGAGYVPLDPAFPVERLEFMAADAGLALLLTESKHTGIMQFDAARSLVIDAAGALESASANFVDIKADADTESVAYVIYTSGSTGKPKGVRVPHRSVANFLASMRKQPGLDASDRLLAVTTLSFDIAVLELFLPLTTGATVVLASREENKDGREIAALLDEQQISVMQATPSTWRMLLESGWQRRPGFRALCGGEPLHADLAAELLQNCDALWNLYGPTETTVWSTLARIEDPMQGISIGQPIDNTTVWVLDEHAAACPIGVPGEIAIGGAGVTLGYLERPELTADRFIADPFSDRAGALLYRTGDCGRWRNDGSLQHLGRLDHQVKLRGFRIELGEIETNLASHPAIAQVVALVREDRPGDQRLVAYLTVQPGATVEFDDAALRTHLRTTLPDYMVPQYFMRLDSIPLLPNGKINRALLPSPLATVASASGPDEAPRSDVERRVGKAMEETLALPGIGIHDDFFALGGHSLLAAQLTARLNREFSVALSLRSIFDTPNVAGLAAAVVGQLESGQTVGHEPVPHREEQSRAPLSLMQERLWLLEKLHPGRVAYNTPSAHRLRGVIDESAFERAFADMIERQPILRAAIRDEDGVVEQVVEETIDLKLFPAEDLSGIATDSRETELLERLQALTDTPFDLTRAPLFSVRMFKLEEHDHVLFFMPHHMIWDGWSFDLFYVELSAFYSARKAGRDADLAPLAVSYGDFAEWHRGWLEGPQLQAQLEFWRERLAQAGKPNNLPTDRPRRAGMSGEGRTEWIRIDRAQTDALHTLAREADATVNMTLLALYFVLLHGVTGERDLVIGTPVRGRNRSELESVMGYFTNLVPLYVTLTPHCTFIEFVREIKRVVIDSFGSPDVPLEHLQSELKRVHGSDALLYQALFSFQDARQRSTDWSGLEHEQILLFQRGATEDLGLWFLENANGMIGGVTYNADIFRADTARMLRERYLELVTSVLADPRKSISALTRGGTAEPVKRVAPAPMTLADDQAAACLHALFEQQAARTPSANALRVGSWGTSFTELDQRANRLAAVLDKRGAGPDVCVALLAEGGINRIAALLGIFKTGARCLPLDPADPPSRLVKLLECAGASIIVGESTLENELGWPREKALWLDADTTEIVSAASERFAGAAIDASAIAICTVSPAASAAPQVLAFSHRFINQKLAAVHQALGIGGSERLLATMAVDTMMAQIVCLLGLVHGNEVVLASRDDLTHPDQLGKLVLSSKADVVFAAADTLQALLCADSEVTYPARVVCLGSKPSASLAEELRARSKGLWTALVTDATIIASCGQVEAPLDGVHIGAALNGIDLQVLDDSGAALSVGAIGEICISDETGADTVHRSGYRGRWLSSQHVEELGRIDRRLCLHGRNVEPAEIENLLNTIDGVARSLVIARADRRGVVRLLAYVTANAGAALDSARMTAALAGQLPVYAVPDTIVILEAFPMLANGKVDSAALPTPAPASQADTASNEPNTPAEQLLADIWKSMLHVSRIRADDNFFDLGGDSLLALSMVVKVEKATRVRLNLLKLANSNLRALAAELPDAAVLQSAQPRSGLQRALGLFGLGKKSP
ncbi:MAG TPA: amino acid adenylation domain-containing protein [Dokdonella sp.]|uniref:non-ribosomal peptide synthetase n=1 Tax=Dokdonella sp. TaxID=2291710 RepID=UPI002D810574|nr:non-ribosomal peptide synthetase [Dokdonella sp.]HET9032644.1 amino acid adenylation domain-containing protein [Dokdonella sp.]